MSRKSEVTYIAESVMDRLRGIEEDLGVTFSRGNGSFDAQTFSIKITATSNGADGESQSLQELDFIKHAVRFGLSASDLGRKFTNYQGSYTIVGMKPKSRKYPVLVTKMGSTGTYKVTADMVISSLKSGGQG